MVLHGQTGGSTGRRYAGMNDAMRYRLELGDEARERARVEDLDDLRDLNEAIARNNGKSGTAWEQVKKELGIG